MAFSYERLVGGFVKPPFLPNCTTHMATHWPDLQTTGDGMLDMGGGV